MNTRNAGRHLATIATTGAVGGSVALATVLGMQFAGTQKQEAKVPDQVAVVTPQMSTTTTTSQSVPKSQGSIKSPQAGSAYGQPRTLTSGS